MGNKFFPKTLWTPSFTYWWLISLCSLLMFDLFWMGQTTFRTLSMFAFWPMLFLYSTLLTFPSLVSKRPEFNLLLLLIANGFMIANLMYGRTYFNAIPARSYLLAGNLTEFGASVADSFRWYFIFLPIFSIGSYIFYLIRVKNKWVRPDVASYFALTGVLLLIIWLGDLGSGGVSARIDKMNTTAYEASSVMPVYGIPVFVTHDILKSAREITPEQKAEVDEWLRYHKIMSKEVNENDTLEKKRPKNLILLLCESLESWPLLKSVEGKEMTPYLNSLINDSNTFYAPHLITQADNGRSIEGQLLILSGMLPMRQRVYAYDAVENKFFTLPDAMKKTGGKTYLLTCDKPYVWNQQRVAKAFGIDTLLNAGDFIIDEKVGAARRLSDGHLMMQSVEKLRKGEVWPEGEKAFLMWVTYSGHNPFNLPSKLRKLDFDGDYPEIIKNYMITANYTDSALATLIEYLKTRSDWSDTMVVITGDHEGLAIDRNAALQNTLSAEFVDPKQHTPLIILNAPRPGRYIGEIGQVDAYSTIIDQMGWHDYPWQGLGVSVLNPDFPGIAVGTAGDIHGDTEKISETSLQHIIKARDISDLILRYDLLR